MLHVFKNICTLICITLFAGLLVQCSSRRTVQWHYIIPDGYQGYLAIRYNCPAGQPLVETKGVIIIHFNADGTFCTSDSFFASTGHLPTAETASGQPIPYIIDPRQHQGYAICCGNKMVIGGNTLENPSPNDLELELMWVGEMHPRPRDAPEVPDDIHTFLQDRFGLRDVRN